MRSRPFLRMSTGCLLFALCFAFEAAGASPNVVFLSADTLRADHLGCYGYDKPTSPVIDRLARQSVLFEDCVCEVPLTNPSFGAMLSSLYPRTTGTTRNGLRMPPGTKLVPELFKDAGYQTFCVQSNWTLKGRLSGLDKGFDCYRDDFTKKRWGVMGGERDAKDVTDTALQLLQARDAQKPFLAWFHYSDPHAPYLFHEGFDPWQGVHPKGKEEHVRRNYDSEIAYMDHEIGRLLEALPKENTVIVFVSDHGESLYEHRYLGHGRRIYQTNLHIPLLISAPGLAPRRETAPVHGIDVGPTLLALAGLNAAPGMQGQNLLVQLPPLNGSRFVETYGGAVPRMPGFKVLMGNRPPMRRAVIQDGWKLIVGEGKDALFHLSEDPGELCDRAAGDPERAHKMRALLDAWGRKHPRNAGHAADLSKEDVEALESLGYLK